MFYLKFDTGAVKSRLKLRPVVRQNLARPNLISFVVSHSSSSFYDLQTDRWPQVAPGTRRQDRSLASAQRATCQVITLEICVRMDSTRAGSTGTVPPLSS